MSDAQPNPGLGNLGSILDDTTAPPPAIAGPAIKQPSALARWAHERRVWIKRIRSLVALTLVLVGGIYGILAFVPRPAPDYMHDEMAELLDYTLLSDDFNKLPIEKRLALLKDLIKRLKTMTATDSAVMASFAASLESKMRKQMERNVKRLAADMIDNYAKDYASVPPNKQDDYLDDAIVNFTHLMEDIADQPSGLPASDADRVAAVKNQAKKDAERMREGDQRISAGRAAKFFEFIHNDQDQVSDPQQRGRNAKFMRDMTRHLRGRDIATNQPVDGPK